MDNVIYLQTDFVPSDDEWEHHLLMQARMTHFHQEVQHEARNEYEVALRIQMMANTLRAKWKILTNLKK